jgi:hypothetical protein
MSEAEIAFVNAFVAKDARERWLSLLPSERGRGKITVRLAHTLLKDLDTRFVYDKDAPPPDIAAAVQKVREQWAVRNPKRLCHIIANNSEVDGQTMSLSDAEADPRLTFGALILLIPDRLAYYHTERSNLNKQPYYLLFRP